MFKLTQSESIIKTISYVFIAISIISYVAYSMVLAIDLPWGDHWRWIRGLLIHYINGRIGFFEYVTGEFYPFQHSHMVTLFVVWINYLLFDLNYSLGFYIGLISHLILMFCLSKVYLKDTREFIDNRYALLILMLIIAIMFNQRNFVLWSLVQFEYFYLLTTFGFLYLFDAYIKQRVSMWLLGTCIPLVFFLGDAMGVAALLAVIGFIIVFEIKHHYKTLLMIIATLAACTWLSHLLIPNMHQHSASMLDAINFFVNNPLVLISFVIKVCAQTLTEPASLKILFDGNWEAAEYIVGIVVSVFILSAVGLFIRFRGRLFQTDMPILLVSLTFMTVLGIMFSRLPVFGDDIAHSNRYIRLFQLGFVGALWINMKVIFYFIKHKPEIKKSLIGVSVGVFSIVLIGFCFHNVHLWKYHGSKIKASQRSVDTLRLYGEDLDYDVGSVVTRCKNDFCRPSVIFLKQNKLSIFRTQE